MKYTNASYTAEINETIPNTLVIMNKSGKRVGLVPLKLVEEDKNTIGSAFTAILYYSLTGMKADIMGRLLRVVGENVIGEGEVMDNFRGSNGDGVTLTSCAVRALEKVGIRFKDKNGDVVSPTGHNRSKITVNRYKTVV